MAADASKSTSSADSYIGSLISLTSKSEIRYEGVLYTINADESSIGLRNVRSFGSEGRKKDGPQIPPSDRVYEYILFRGTDIKDLQVKSAPPVQTTSMVDSDPAIIQSHYPPPSATSTNYPPPPATLTNYPPPPAALTNYPPPPAALTNYPPPPATSTNYPPPPATSANYPPPPATSANYPPPPATSASYPPPPATSTSFPSAVSVSPADMNFHAPQMGHPGSNFPGSNFPGGMPLYHQGASLGSWGPSPPSVNGNSLPMPVYWPGMYGLPNTLPHLHQHTFLQPPLGLSVPPALQQQMPYSGLSAPPQTAFPNVSSSSSTLPTTSSSSTSIGFNPPPLAGSLNLPSLSSPLLSATSGSTALSSSSLQSIPYSGVSAPAQAAAINVPNASSMLFAPNSSSAILGFNPPPPAVTMNVPSSIAPLLAAVNSSSALPSSSLPPLNLPAVPSLTVASEIPSGSVFDKGLNSGHPSEASNGGLPTLASLTISDSETISVNPPVSNKASSSTLLPYQNLSQTATSVVSSSTPSKKEGKTPSLVTPGQLLQPKKSQISSQSSQITHKHVEVIQVSSSTEETVSVPKEKEAQPPILPLPPAPRPYHKPNDAPQVRHIYRGGGRHSYRGDGRGRGTGGSRPVTRFTEDFDFSAMNEKFNKDEVWDHLGKNKIHSDDKEGGEIEEGGYVDDLPKIEVKPVYNKDDFFDSLSSNARNNESQNARPRFSEQLKIDAETFGEFARYRGGRGGRGPGRGGRGSNYGRGYGYDRSGRGYGHPGRGGGRGRALSSQAS